MAKSVRLGKHNLTPQELMFCDYLISYPNEPKVNAARYAGYSESTAKTTAYQVAKRPQVVAYLKEKRAVSAYDIQGEIDYCKKHVLPLPLFIQRLKEMMYSETPSIVAIATNAIMEIYGLKQDKAVIKAHHKEVNNALVVANGEDLAALLQSRGKSAREKHDKAFDAIDIMDNYED